MNIKLVLAGRRASLAYLVAKKYEVKNLIILLRLTIEGFKSEEIKREAKNG
jgi:vacuolar-type H+-ATPase subunit C/Vma6